jgi:hypothetical protein
MFPMSRSNRFLAWMPGTADARSEWNTRYIKRIYFRVEESLDSRAAFCHFQPQKGKPHLPAVHKLKVSVAKVTRRRFVKQINLEQSEGRGLVPDFRTVIQWSASDPARRYHAKQDPQAFTPKSDTRNMGILSEPLLCIARLTRATACRFFVCL